MPHVTLRLCLAIVLLSIITAVNPAQAIDPRFEIAPEKLQEKQSAKPAANPPPARKTPEAKAAGESTYIIKSGDNLLKILARQYGMSSDAAEAIIPAIKTRNGIHDIKRLKTGDKLFIPFQVKPARHFARKSRAVTETLSRPPLGNSNDHGIALFMHPQGIGPNGLENVKHVWGRFFPAGNWPGESLTIKSNAFSLELDPVKFPMLPAADGGRILIESGGNLSPLVKTLIRNYDPGIRFVSYNPSNIKSFYSGLFASAGFFSVEDNFTVDFGTDTKLTVYADFKVEKTADSSLQQDIALVNVDPRRSELPAQLTDYLGRQGLKMVEFDSGYLPAGAPHESQIRIIQAGEPVDMAKSMLEALDVESDRDREINLLSMAGEGVSLRVKVERYFEKNGEKFVVSTFRGDPESYTLLRILETMKYNVIILDQDEGFKSIAGKLLSRLRLPGRFAMQTLIASGDLSYRVQMTGIMLNKTDNRGGQLFLTDHQPDKMISQLLEHQGYSVINSR